MPAQRARRFDVGRVVVQEDQLFHRVTETFGGDLVDGRLGLVVAHAAAEHAVLEQPQEAVRGLQVGGHRCGHVRQVVQRPPRGVQPLQQRHRVGQRRQRTRRAVHHALHLVGLQAGARGDALHQRLGRDAAAVVGTPVAAITLEDQRRPVRGTVGVEGTLRQQFAQQRLGLPAEDDTAEIEDELLLRDVHELRRSAA